MCFSGLNDIIQIPLEPHPSVTSSKRIAGVVDIPVAMPRLLFQSCTSYHHFSEIDCPSTSSLMFGFTVF